MADSSGALGAAAAPDPSLPARGLNIATPANWFQLDLDPATRHASIERMLDERVGAEPEYADLRRELSELLRKATSDAADQDAVRAYLLADMVAGRPVSASLTCTITSTPELVGLHDVALGLRGAAERSGPPSVVEEVELAAGRAVRARARRTVEMSGTVGRTVDVESVQYFVPIPGHLALLILSFSTPNLLIADALAELFDAISGTLRWDH